MAYEYDQHPVNLANESTDLSAGPISRMADAATKGVTAAALSGGLSIYNTLSAIKGEDNVEVETVLRDMDAGATADYYEANKDAIDLVGFVGASIVPGGLGIKALKLARGGEALGAFGRGLGLPASRKAFYMEQALKETAESGGTVAGILSKTRRSQLLWESADQAMQATAAELAIAATMNDSPVFDNASLKDFGVNVAIGTVFGGVVGGALASISAKGILKAAQTEIEFSKRAVDTVFDPQKLGLTKGTETLLFAESISKLPDDFINTPFSYRFDGKLVKVEGGLPTAGAFKSAKERAQTLANQQLSLKFNELAEGDEVFGQAYFDFMRRGIEASRAAGKDADEIVALTNGYLNNVRKVGPVDPDRMALDAKKFYVNMEPTSLGDIFTPKRTKTSSKLAYYLEDGVTEADLKVEQIGNTGFATLKDAWRSKNAPDVILLEGGRAAINPASSKVRKLLENPTRVRMYMDLETGTLDESALLHIGDTLKGGRLINGDASVEAGGKVYLQEASRAFDTKLSTVDAGARFVWASKFTPTQLRKITGGLIAADDLALHTRLVELVKAGEISPAMLGTFTIVERNGLKTVATDFMDLSKSLDTMKAGLLEETLRVNGASDVRHLAAHLGESPDWVEHVIANNFVPSAQGSELIPRLSTVDALRPRNIQVEWEFNAVKNKMLPEEAYKEQFGPNFQSTVELTRQYQLATRSLVQETAVNASMGAEDAGLLGLDAGVTSELVNQAGAGASIFGASNAGYAQRALAGVQNLGKNIALISQRRRDAAIESLASAVNAVRTNPTAAAELGVLTTALRRAEHRYMFDPTSTGLTGNKLLSKPLVEMMVKEKVDVATALRMLTVTEARPPRIPHTLDVLSDQAAEFLRQHTKLNDTRQGRFTPLYNAIGMTSRKAEDNFIYVPPINTVKYPYHAFVRTKGQIGVATDVTMITARSEDQLRTLAAKVDAEKYDVFFKQDTDNYFKAKGTYDYDMTLNESRINSDLTRSGALADLFPETKAENVLTDFLEFHAKQEEKLVRTAAQVRNRQFFSEVQFLSENYRTVSESVTRGIGSRFKSKVSDPFGDFIKTGLNISKQQEFPLLDSLNEFVDKVGMQMGEAINANWNTVRNKDVAGPKPWEVADSIAKRFGMGTPYSTSDDAFGAYVAANSSFPRNLIRESFQKANMLLANFTLRLDFANSLVNILSTPIMIATEVSSLRKLAKGDAELGRVVEGLFHVKVPGQEIAVPSTTKLIGNATKMFFGPDSAQRMARYKKLGIIKDVSTIYKEVLDDLSFDSLENAKSWYNRTNAAVDKMSKFTGNQFSEDFTRFVSAAVMEQITDPLIAAGKMSAKEADGFMSIFVNRTQGNYITSQRPVVFQGTTGAAVSLFQTYAFNVLQQLHRHIEIGDKKTLAVFAGMQSTVFGFNGLPFFDAVNTHLIGGMLSGNSQHKDAYEALPAFNKEIGDWMLYGTASAFPLFDGSFNPALYTRGDINPRHISILPTNPLDIPAVSASIRLATTVYDFGKNLVKGVDLSSAMLQGLEHQGVNRPLAGFAQLLAGRSTTSQGSLISAANEMQATSWLGGLAERTVEYGGVSRLMGARPMDEAVALNAAYRNKSYEAMDRARVSNLGRVVKSKLYDGEVPTQVEVEEFMQQYTAAGGRIENFNKAMQRWTRDANVSMVNQMADKMNSNAARKLKVVMGGEDLPDYRNGSELEPSIGDSE